MRTECKLRFEFHQLSQRKVKARFDGGKITMRGTAVASERGTGLIAGLAECFRDHRDARLIEHTVEELLGQRIYGLCLGYELNDHDPHRPMLAVAVNKADPLGERRRQASDRGKALAGRCTLNRLELTGAEVDEQERYKKIWTRTGSTAGWWMPSWSPTNRRPRRSCWIWMRRRPDPASRKAGSFTVTRLLLSPAVHLLEHLLCARLRCSNIDGAAGSVEELERIVGRIRQSWPEVSIVIRADSMTCSAGVKTITWIT